MKSTDSLVPYMLASMHPLGHMILLASGVGMILYDPEGFYAVKGTCKTNTAAYYFMTEGKNFFMFYMLTAHLAATLLHYGSQLASHFGYKTIANVALVVKVLGYLWTVMLV